MFTSCVRKNCTILFSVSDWCSVTFGVPHGSFLGPLLFLLFVNDIMMLFLPPFSNLLMITQSSDELNHKILQQAIQNIFQWTICNIASSYSFQMLCYAYDQMSRSISPNFCRSYFMGDGKLDEVDGFKLLGVTFSKDLSFNSQVGLFGLQ